MSDFVFALNCGSSSIKFALFAADATPLPRQPAWGGQVVGITGQDPILQITGAAPHRADLHAQGSEGAAASGSTYQAAVDLIMQRLHEPLGGGRLVAIVHRVVHGGAHYFDPVRVDAVVLDALRRLIPLAPLHQPHALEAIALLLASLPETPQIACFDTAFHRSLAPVEQMLPLPWSAWERGLRRYGFHGLSYAYLAIALAQRHGTAARGRTIIAHLGSGASLCAMHALSSVATTMGFSALDGLMMGTRCGTLDPGAVLYLMEVEKLSLAAVGHVLYHESGLLGVSGLSADPRELLRQEHTDSRAHAALALYVRGIVREIGALVATLGGLDMLVFTAGVGEHNATIRERVCQALEFLGVVLHEPANAANAPIISAPTSRVVVAVEPTNEEWIAATQAIALLA